MALAPFAPVPGEHREWRIQTVAGPLEVTLYEGSDAGPWLACCFADVGQAREHLGIRAGDCSTRLNPWSGKWNWHWHEFGPYTLRPSKAEKLAAGRQMIAAFCSEVQLRLR
jgi:hypothetical protein